MAGKDAPPSGQKGKISVEDIAATIEENLHELSLPMGKTELVEKIRDRIDVSKERIYSALAELCESGILEVRKGDPLKKTAGDEVLLSRTGLLPGNDIKFRANLTILRPKKLKTRKSFLSLPPLPAGQL